MRQRFLKPSDFSLGFLRPALLSWVVVFLLLIFAIWLQSQMYINGDPCWGMQVALRMLRGGNYMQSFFDVNAPMTFYVYLLPAGIAAAFKWDPITVVRVYVFVLAVASWGVCYALLKHGLGKEAPGSLRILQIAIAFVFLIFPASSFAEREHILLLLTLPYFLLVFLRANNQSIGAVYAVVLGLLAGIGFAIKPFFICSLILTEIYLAAYKKTWRVWWRPEALAIMLVMVSYLASVFILFPEYVQQVVPMALHIYYPYVAVPYVKVLFLSSTLFVAFIAVIFFVSYKQLRWPPLAAVTVLATIGFWLAFVLQRTLWYYHALPFLAFSILALVVIACDFVEQNNVSQQAGKMENRIIYIIVSVIFILFYPLATNIHVTREAISYAHKSVDTPVIATIKRLAEGRTVYFFSVIGSYPIVDYAKVHSVSRFNDLWMSAVLYGDSVTHKPLAVDVTKEKQFLHNAIIEDLSKGKPWLILVALSKTDPALVQYNFNIHQQQFIQILLQDPRFRQIWKNYKYVGQVGDNAIYLRNTSS